MMLPYCCCDTDVQMLLSAILTSFELRMHFLNERYIAFTFQLYFVPVRTCTCNSSFKVQPAVNVILSVHVFIVRYGVHVLQEKTQLFTLLNLQEEMPPMNANILQKEGRIITKIDT